jgi:hypothetical protein
MLLIKPLPMSNLIESPATTSVPVQLSEPEFIAFIFPHLSMPRWDRHRGPALVLKHIAGSEVLAEAEPFAARSTLALFS